MHPQRREIVITSRHKPSTTCQWHHGSGSESEPGGDRSLGTDETDNASPPPCDTASASRLTAAAAVVASCFSAAARRGRTAAPARSRLPSDRRHQASARGRSASLDRTVESKSLVTASGSEYCSSGSSGTAAGMPRTLRCCSRPCRFRMRRSHTGGCASGRIATAGKSSAICSVYISYLPGSQSHW